jgi:hypothetical protein
MAQINPAFRRHPEEAALVGRIVVHFGELEFSFCRSTANSLNMYVPLMKALYSLRATSSRIDFADGLIRNLYLGFGLEKEYDIAVSMVRFCLRIRNLYAHCNWVDDHSGNYPGLFYADLQDSAKTPNLDLDYRHVDVSLLQRQEDYFSETMEWLTFIDHEMAVKLQRLSSHVWPRPSELEQPPLHNPASQHIPPWLTLDQQSQHLSRAQEQEAPPHQPERPPSVLKLTEQEWIAKYRKEGRPLPDRTSAE